MHVTQLRSMTSCPQLHLQWTEPWITSASNNLLPKFRTKTTIPIACTGSRKMVWRGGHAPHIVHWWHPNSPKPKLCTSHQPILPPNFTSKNKPNKLFKSSNGKHQKINWRHIRKPQQQNHWNRYTIATSSHNHQARDFQSNHRATVPNLRLICK